MSQEQNVPSSVQFETRREERVCQLQRLLSPLLEKRRRTSWRAIDINSLKIIPLAPLVRLVQSVEGTTLFNIYQKSIQKARGDPQAPLHFYYSKIKSPIGTVTILCPIITRHRTEYDYQKKAKISNRQRIWYCEKSSRIFKKTMFHRRFCRIGLVKHMALKLNILHSKVNFCIR